MTTPSFPDIAELPVLYIKPGCTICEEVVAFLDEHGVAYREVDICDRPSGRTEMEKKTGQSAVPVLDWHGRVLLGFDKEELVAFLQSRDVKLEDS